MAHGRAVQTGLNQTRIGAVKKLQTDHGGQIIINAIVLAGMDLNWRIANNTILPQWRNETRHPKPKAMRHSISA